MNVNSDEANMRHQYINSPGSGETQIVHEKRVISNDENSLNTFFENVEWIIEPILQLDYMYLSYSLTEF